MLAYAHETLCYRKDGVARSASLEIILSSLLVSFGDRLAQAAIGWTAIYAAVVVR